MKQLIEHYFNSHKYESKIEPEIKIENCVCGKLPVKHSSSGGFNYYDYYSCDNCKLFATGRHQFPSAISDLIGNNERNEPKLFVRYDGEHNAESGWNEFIRGLTTTNEKA